mmetsp:Transcript_19287/g.55991  ORF Transcript_19287/g.55991 Transcript_19287/m.55991 type:complete len:200 (+) Transcript_19287:658-1257(+)
MASGTVAKCLGPTSSVSMVSCVKAMANTYSSRQSRHSVKKTDRVAAAIPLIRIMSSGIARRSRAILAMRVSRASRKTRRIDALPKPPELAPPMIRIRPVVTHVSTTITNTSTESKANQVSFNPLRFFSNAMKRTNHSKKKKAQKACSASWKTGWASSSTSSLLRSVSSPIQMELKAITQSVTFSNLPLVAMRRQMPLSL